ncbi:hypothetical protein BIV57_12580 [Mangrovactinospora gilvigrisea]|uniref:Oxo-4-hydroxy-4-carboxy-5-ureidoimidazoline decarboxylase domain-containing protein n=1 Tax=Mangrovactinospora gilvigrisea TaxID=1428644 RepID=A0A1J7BEU1_9ACTN|nr:hypothetical protein BIV57_12580 [Mangrovactinospora gilvigrisea]
MLTALNRAPAEQAVSLLASCCGCRAWAERVALHRPYPDAASALAAAEEAFFDLTEQQLDEAFDDERAAVPVPSPSTAGAHAAGIALRAAQQEYRERFGRAFLLSVDDFPVEEVLDQVLFSIRGRLGHTPERERAIAAEELRKLLLARMARLLTG